MPAPAPVTSNHPGEFTDANTVTSITHSFPLSSGSDRKVMAGVSVEDAAATTDAVTTGGTCNGTAMTQVVEVIESGVLALSVWEILDASLPAGGASYNVVVSFTGTVDKSSIIVTEMTGADQAAYDAVQSHSENSSTLNQTVELTTLVADSLIVVFGVNSGGSVTATPEVSDVAATEREEHNATGHTIWMSTGPASTAAAYTSGLTWSAGGGMIVIAVAQAGVGVTTLTKTTSLDAAIQATLNKSASLDAALQVRVQKTVSLEAAIRATLSALVSLDSAIRAEGLMKTLDLDGAVQSTGSVGADLDAALQVLGLTKTTDLDAVIRAVLTKSLSLDASIISGTGTLTRTVDFDAAIKQVGASLTVLMSAAIMVTGSMSLTIDAAVMARTALTVGVDAAVKGLGLTKTVLLDAYLYDPTVGIVTPTPLDGPLLRLADQLAAQFGDPATLTYVSSAAYDPSTGTATTTTTDVSVNAIIEAYTAREIGGTIKAGDLKVLIPGKDLTKPHPTDRFTIGSRTYQVVDVQPIYSGEQAALYRLQVRR